MNYHRVSAMSLVIAVLKGGGRLSQFPAPWSQLTIVRVGTWLTQLIRVYPLGFSPWTWVRRISPSAVPPFWGVRCRSFFRVGWGVLSFFLLKSLLNLLQHCFSFMFWFFICEVLSSPTRDQTHTLLWEGEVLTTVSPGKSQGSCLLIHLILTRSGWVTYNNCTQFAGEETEAQRACGGEISQ